MLFPAWFYWLLGIAAVFTYLFERQAIMAKRDERRAELEHEADLERQGKTRHCDGWHVWWE